MLMRRLLFGSRAPQSVWILVIKQVRGAFGASPVKNLPPMRDFPYAAAGRSTFKPIQMAAAEKDILAPDLFFDTPMNMEIGGDKRGVAFQIHMDIGD